ncbi:hypothetical protein RN001_002502 [Aquatica leii]|uniref:Uncharacterized protein n=1 Tax=Aquatica leii TaxID=1421715 RepID=A0AAN7SDB7_9COLE|nr:hypothetical protein RN001_002502 [Aquatica leii]
MTKAENGPHTWINNSVRGYEKNFFTSFLIQTYGFMTSGVLKATRNIRITKKRSCRQVKQMKVHLVKEIN